MTMNDCIMILFIDQYGKVFFLVLFWTTTSWGSMSCRYQQLLHFTIYLQFMTKSISNVSFEMLNNNRHNVTVDKILHQNSKETFSCNVILFHVQFSFVV